ncbi:hypothetical protein JHK84_049201 [Glycine max]|nr:hypothetical protein JHK85_049921 [Glycine max]KAG5093613.1 hypothetical protein JHK84_049201 [Glycine max]
MVPKSGMLFSFASGNRPVKIFRIHKGSNCLRTDPCNSADIASAKDVGSFVPSGEVKGFKVDALDNTRAGVFVARALSHIAAFNLSISIFSATPKPEAHSYTYPQDVADRERIFKLFDSNGDG